MRRLFSPRGVALAAALGACASPEPRTDGFYRVVSTTTTEPGVEALQIVETRPGVTTRFLLVGPDKPVASVILFAGGHGRLGLDLSGRMAWGRGNFLVRSRRLFLAQGFSVATIDAPSDRQGANGMLFGFRGSLEHALDVAAAVRFLRERFGKPVWLVGTSRGSASAANGGIRLARAGARAPDGIVLTATVTRDNANGLNVLDMDLGAIRVPVVVAHHRRDQCRATPFDRVSRLRKAFGRASEVSVLAYRGGRTEGSPCQARSYHGFLGIEARVVADIAQRIKDP